VDILTKNGIDPLKYELGILCHAKHDWMETGYSLRQKRKGRKSTNCVECSRLASRRYREQNPEKVKEHAKKSYQAQMAKIAASSVESQEEYRQRRRLASSKFFSNNHELCLQRNRASKAKHKEKVLRYGREYSRKNWKIQYRRHWQRIKLYTQERKAKKLLGGEFPGIRTLRECFQYFDSCCVYCSCELDFCVGQNKVQWDHIVPVSKGGQNNLHNLVPSCKSCNSSKYCTDWIAWYSSRPFFCLERFMKINNHTQGIWL
jgi:hypothetical protein